MWRTHGSSLSICVCVALHVVCPFRDETTTEFGFNTSQLLTATRSTARVDMLATTSLGSLAASSVLQQLPSADYGAITKGKLCIVQNWLVGEQLEALRNDVRMLLKEGAFHESGLTTKVDPHKTSSTGPRDEQTRLVCEMRHDLGGDRSARQAIDVRLDFLRKELEEATGRSLCLEEQYYSFSPAGVTLALHMDERHEETKGDDAWTAESRRSISWLLYLSDEGWESNHRQTPEDALEGTRSTSGAGGELRAYCRTDAVAPIGAHEGNLQIGWLRCEDDGGAEQSVDVHDGSASYPDSVSHAVFLDAWCKGSTPDGTEGYGAMPESRLYILQTDGKRTYLTDTISPGEGAFANDGMDWDAFSAALRGHLPSHLQPHFLSVVSTGDAEAEVVHVSPVGGTLVLFDSVAIPHDVAAVERGERLALAGWFHEPQQEWPSWFVP